MCTPSLAIDAIIEIHHGNEGEINHIEKITPKGRKSLSDNHNSESSNLQGLVSNMGVSSGGVPAVSTAAMRTVSVHSLHKTKKNHEKENLPLKEVYSDHDQWWMNSKNGKSKNGNTLTDLKGQSDRVNHHPAGDDNNIRILNSHNLIYGIQTMNSKSNFTKGNDKINGEKKYAEVKKKWENNKNISIVLVYRGAPPAGYAIPGGESCR